MIELKKELDWTVGLNQFTGTEHWYRNTFGMLYTDGMKYVAENAKAYWLIDLIESWQPEIRKRYGADASAFQVWKLSKKDDGTWLARCEDGNNGYLVSQAIEYSSFPIPFFEMWLTNNTLILPSEY